LSFESSSLLLLPAEAPASWRNALESSLGMSVGTASDKIRSD
jgi:hypothetical protein